jgi:hypothetical protein
MNNRDEILRLLKAEFDRWEELLAIPGEEQIMASRLLNGWSIKDLLAHLMAWQQVSIARLEAARLDKEPVLPAWLAGSDPETDEVDQVNARIYETYREQPWPRVYRGWRDGFLRFLELGEEIPEDDLLDAEKYPWLKGYALLAVLQGSYEHHHVDHLESLQAWVDQHRNTEG